jgi:hypothetical protein
MFVEAATKDNRPRFNAVLISAFTVFQNVFQSTKDPTIEKLEQGFVQDINLFLEYYNNYLSAVWSRSYQDKFCPVVVYFPDYQHLDKSIQRDMEGKRGELFAFYKTFLKRHGNENGEVKRLEYCRCVWVQAGDRSYPHKDAVRHFRDIVHHKGVLYTTGDPVGLMASVPLDLYMASRLRNLVLIERHTGKIRKPEEFRLKIHKDGQLPFLPCVHVALGDDILIKPMATPKLKKQIIDAAINERWLTRSEEDIRGKIAKILNVPPGTLRKYDFI